jgi:hypothetical protein
MEFLQDCFESFPRFVPNLPSFQYLVQSGLVWSSLVVIFKEDRPRLRYVAHRAEGGGRRLYG